MGTLMHWGELRGAQGGEDGKSTCSACLRAGMYLPSAAHDEDAGTDAELD